MAYNTSPLLATPYPAADFPLFASSSAIDSHFDLTYDNFQFQPADMRHPSDSAASGTSTISSTAASPTISGQHSDWSDAGLGVKVVPQHDGYASDSLYNQHIDHDAYYHSDKHQGFVVPSMIDPYASHAFTSPPLQSLDFVQPLPHDYHAESSVASSCPSPAPPSRAGPIRSESRALGRWQPYKKPRAQSTISVHSKHSAGSEDEEHKTLCPIASCGRLVRDVKAHVLTHQNERPEKCPIASCPYHTKGFARRYDKNRHTLTHFKGTMVCDFCPGSGAPGEKSFNRTDVFKRHLQSVHSVEQTTPNARRKKSSKDASRASKQTTATCRTCGGSFPNAQDLYDHIDDCVLRVVQEAEPSEAINEKLLASVADDANVKAELLRCHSQSVGSRDGTDDEDEKSEGSSAQSESQISTARPTSTTTSSDGQEGSGRKVPYPPDWTAAKDDLFMKKRIMCVYDGDRRLCRDDMLLATHNEVVRIPLAGDGTVRNSRRYITDIDVLSILRAEALHDSAAASRQDA